MDHLPGTLFLRNLIERRALVYQLVRRDFEQRYIGSAVGWLWGLIHPLVLLLSWTFVFQICMGVKMPRGAITQSYALYLLAGFLPWFLFQETLLRSSTSLVDQANLITKTLFPSELIPLSIFLSTLISHLMTLVMVLTAVIWWTGHLSLQLLALPLYMLLAGLFAVGLGWIFASLQVYLRDTAQVLQVALTLWFWITPIFIDESLYPEQVRFLLRYNPLALLVRAYRERILSARPVNLEELLVLVSFSAAAFLVGGLFFRQLKRGFADVL